MHGALVFALLGLGTGAIYALLAQGIVLIYRGSGVVNLAHGAFAMLGAYTYNALRVEHAWSLPAAMVTSVAVVVLVGLATDQLVMRRLRSASAVFRLMATLGVLLTAQAAAVLIWGTGVIVAEPVIKPQSLSVLGATVTSDRLWLLAIATAITVALTVLWRYTRVGWVMEAVSERRRAAAALGWSPEVVSASTWAAGAGLAALAGILVAPITQLDSARLTLIVIAALAVGLISGFRSFPLTLLGGVAVGIAQSEVGNYVHLQGASETLPFLVIVAVLMVRGSTLAKRGEEAEELPPVGSGRIEPRALLIGAAAGLVALALISSPDWLAALISTFGIAIVLLSLVVLTGYAGQLSLAQYALAGIGALVAGRLVAVAGWPFELAAVAGTLGAVLVGLVFALPALRTRGVSLAIVTLGLASATQAMVFSNPHLAGGQDGLDVGGQTVFGWSIDPISHAGRYAVVTFLVFVLCCLLVANLRRGRSGRYLLAVRDNERAAAASGISVLGAKLYAFGVSGALAGIGGVMLGFQSPSVTFLGRWEPLASINAVAQVAIGGLGFVLGPLLGAPIAPSSLGSLVTLQFQQFSEYLALLAGVGLLGALVGNANGIASSLAAAVRRLRLAVPVLAPRRSADAEALLAGVGKPERVAPRSLTVENLGVRYGGVVAVDGVGLEVRPGQIVGLIGPNGAGKTSLMDAVSGFVPYRGSVSIDARPIDGLSPQRRARAGLVRSFQGLELFSQMTVLENVQTASERRDGISLLADLIFPRRRPLPPMAVAALREFGLLGALERRPGELSFGQRRLVAIARAVAMEPSILMLDEPVAGLDEQESREFAQLVRRLADEFGIAVLVIEHDMSFVMSIADRLEVIDFGKPIAAGSPEEVANDPAAIAAYLGDQEEEGALSGIGGEGGSR